VVSRKAHDRPLSGIRAALRGGASWEQIAEALGVPADFARKCFNEAIAERLDADAAAAAGDLAGARPYRPDSRAQTPPRRGPGLQLGSALGIARGTPSGDFCPLLAAAATCRKLVADVTMGLKVAEALVPAAP
jgi:hypothetical protein